MELNYKMAYLRSGFLLLDKKPNDYPLGFKLIRELYHATLDLVKKEANMVQEAEVNQITRG